MLQYSSQKQHLEACRGFLLYSGKARAAERFKGRSNPMFSISGLAPNDQQPLEGSEGGSQEQSSPNTSAPQVSLLFTGNP